MNNNAVVDAVSNVPFGVVLAYVAGGIAILVAVIFLGIRIYKVIEKYRHVRNKVDAKDADFEKLKQNDVEMKKSMHAITAAVQQLLADRLNQRIRYYYKIGYIPQDELENFQRQYGAYREVEGNGEMEIRFHKCLDDLHVQVVSKKNNTSN